MDQMQTELDADYPELNIQFVGVNEWGQEVGNPEFTDGQDIPWLQDVDSDGDDQSDVWSSWDVVFRDIVIVNADSEIVTIFNVTENNLRVQENYDKLRQILIDTEQCSAGDANRDGIFNSTDLIQVFQAAEYEDDEDGNSTWAEGDWNFDGDFNTSDLVTAFQCGSYVAAAVAADPNSTPRADFDDIRSFLDSSPSSSGDRKQWTARDEVFQSWSQPVTPRIRNAFSI